MFTYSAFEYKQLIYTYLQLLVGTRKCHVISDLKYFPDIVDWEGIKCLICIESKRILHNKTSIEKRYYISSLAPDAKALENIGLLKMNYIGC